MLDGAERELVETFHTESESHVEISLVLFFWDLLRDASPEHRKKSVSRT